MSDQELGVVEALQSLRLELLHAIDAGQGQRLQFGLAPVQVTLQVQATKTGETGIGWAVLKAGGKYEHATTHTLTLTLTPVLELASGGKTSDVKIAGTGAAGDRFGPTPD